MGKPRPRFRTDSRKGRSKMAEVLIYSQGNPKGTVTGMPENPVGVEVTKHSPATGKTEKVTKKKSDRN